MTDSHIRAGEWTTQVRGPLQTNHINTRQVLAAAAIAGLELKFNQVEELWYWQSTASTALDWRGTGYPTRADACRAFNQGASHSMTPAELTAERKRLGLSQVKLARLLGVAANTVNRWEAGTRAIPAYLHLTLRGIAAERQVPKP